MFRLAPTPSGYLHTGNAYAFLLAARLAEKSGTDLLLRIDDSDAERKRPEYIRDVFDSLKWLGINWTLGPKDEMDFEARWSQRHRLLLYNSAIEKLIATGKAFACSCSRRQLQERPCDCSEKNIPVDKPDTALRLLVPPATQISFYDEQHGKTTVDLSAETGSFVIRRRDGIPAYQLISVIDDLHFGVDFIVRGNDLLASTAAQIFLAASLGEKDFAAIKFLHHPLITDESGNKLSKSEGASSLKAMRENGQSSRELIENFYRWCERNSIAFR
jgi:glutamyl-tRNA synthetase